MIQLYSVFHVTFYFFPHCSKNSIKNFELSKTLIHKKKKIHIHLFLQQSTDANLTKTLNLLFRKELENSFIKIVKEKKN